MISALLCVPDFVLVCLLFDAFLKMRIALVCNQNRQFQVSIYQIAVQFIALGCFATANTVFFFKMTSVVSWSIKVALDWIALITLQLTLC